VTGYAPVTIENVAQWPVLNPRATVPTPACSTTPVSQCKTLFSVNSSLTALVLPTAAH